MSDTTNFGAPLNVFYWLVYEKNNWENKFAKYYFKQYDLKSLPVSLNVLLSIPFYLEVVLASLILVSSCSNTEINEWWRIIAFVTKTLIKFVIICGSTK